MTSKNLTTNRTLPAGRTILKRLGELSGKLEAMLPTNERGSVMDVVCTSDLGIYNVEVQVVPQDCWDIRILHHVCGLFHNQFRVGMTWEGLAKDREIGDKIKRVIGVSIFAKPYTMEDVVPKTWSTEGHKTWESDEVERRFKVQTDDGIQRGGIEFIDINLAGKPPDGVDTEFLEWFEFLGSAHLKPAEAGANAKSTGVRQAYKLVKTENLPGKLLVRYQKEMVATANVVHFTEAMHDAGMAKGKAEVAKRMLRAGMASEEVVSLTGLTEQLVKQLAEEGEKDVKEAVADTSRKGAEQA